MNDRQTVIPRVGENTSKPVDQVELQPATGTADLTDSAELQDTLTETESDIREKVFFEDDEKVQLRDGKTYYIPPLALKDGRTLMKKLNTIDSGVIIANLIPDSGGEDDRFDELMDVLLMAFKPYYKYMTVEHLQDYVDLETAKKIIDSMIGLNGLKKSL
jgi:hypothetical protein